MSVFVHHSLSSSYLYRPLTRSFSSTSLVLWSATGIGSTLHPDRRFGQLEPDSQTLSVSRRKRDEGSFAETVSHARPEKPRRNLLKETKVQDYLDHIASTSQEVTLADIERYKPSKLPSPRSPEYEEKYNVLVETLVRSFSLDQLRKFLEMYNLKVPPRRNKWEMAVAIVERQWNWPSLIIVKKEKRDWTEVIHESFPLDARQSFLILGKDGADLLALSMEFNAHVSFSANPLSLKVESFRGSLNDLGRHINEFKAGIQEQNFQLPSGESVEPESLRRISRLSGVFVEDMGHGVIRISYRREDDRAAHYAKRLTMHAAMKVTQKIPTLVYSTPGGAMSTNHALLSPHLGYSLYPFLTSRSERSMVKPGGFFRIRRVGDWPGSNLSARSRNAAGLADEGVPNNLNGEPVDLRHSLLKRVAAMSGNESNPNIIITASFGHLVVVSNSWQRSSITPPLKGTLELSTILEWLRSQNTDRFFIPSLPARLINSSPAQQHLIHRVVYHSFPIEESDDSQTAKILRFELVPEFLNTCAPNKVERTDQENSSSPPGNHLQDHSSAMSSPVGGDITLEPKCWTGTLSHLDLMMPERPMDVRLSISTNAALLEAQWPKDLRDYSDGLRSFLTVSGPAAVQPVTPLTLVHGGANYKLKSSSTVRQSWATLPNTPTASPHPAVIESILESESNQRSRVCMLTCDHIASDDSWATFLDHCDHLTAPVQLKRVPNGQGFILASVGG